MCAMHVSQSYVDVAAAKQREALAALPGVGLGIPDAVWARASSPAAWLLRTACPLRCSWCAWTCSDIECIVA